MKPKANHAGDTSVSGPMDRCQTPAYAVTPLVPYLHKNWHIWEPAAGEGLMVTTLRGFGFRVTSSDILTGHNFFAYQPDSWDALVTNPPYSIKFEWLARCYELCRPFALLVPLEMIGAASAQVLMKQHGAEIILLDKRVDFKMPEMGFEGSAQFPVIWLTHGLGIGREITYATLNKPNARQRKEHAAGVTQLALPGAAR
jgi:hypothetical protein